MASSVPTLSYSTGDFGAGETTFRRTDADGNRYVIRSSSAEGTNHAMALFTGDNYQAYWQPGSGGGQAIYYRNFDDQMQQVEGDKQWVEIKLPAKYALNEYTLHHNIPYNQTFDGPSGNVPTAWLVLGSEDRTNWTLLHEDNRGINAWRDTGGFGGFSEIKNGSVKGITGNHTPFQYFRFVFKSWNKEDDDEKRLDRIKMMISAGSASEKDGTDVGTDDETAGPPTKTPTGDDKDENKVKEFIEEYKWFLLAAAVAILVAVVMYT